MASIVAVSAGSSAPDTEGSHSWNSLLCYQCIPLCIPSVGCALWQQCTDTEGSQASIPALLPVYSTVYSIVGCALLAAVTDTEGSQASIPALLPVYSSCVFHQLAVSAVSSDRQLWKPQWNALVRAGIEAWLPSVSVTAGRDHSQLWKPQWNALVRAGIEACIP